jgi:amphi-Trp domain-containing protein
MSEFERGEEHTRAEVAQYLRKLAVGLEQENKLTFVAGDQSATIDPPETLHFRVETREAGSWIGGDDGRSFLLELGWEPVEDEADEELVIVNDTTHDREPTTERH